MSATATHDLRTKGYAVLEDLLSSDEAARLRAVIMEEVSELEPAKFYSPDTVMLDERSGISSSGVFIHKLFYRRPETRQLMLRGPVVDAVSALFGEGTHLEETGAMVSNAERPFFPWHTHIDGVDEGVRLRANEWPRIERPERVLTLLYLDDIDDARGPVYVVPRAIGEPNEPLGSEHDLEWPGRIELTPRAGTMVVLEQCTWHCARPLTLPGHRVVAGMYVAADSAKAPEWADPTLRSLPWSVPKAVHDGA